MSFDWECIHEAPQYIADLSGRTLTLRYSGRDSAGAQNYLVDVLEVGDDLTLTSLMESGYLDAEYYTRAEEDALRKQLADLRENNTGDDVILVSTGLRAALFLANQVDVLAISGTAHTTATN